MHARPSMRNMPNNQSPNTIIGWAFNRAGVGGRPERFYALSCFPDSLRNIHNRGGGIVGIHPAAGSLLQSYDPDWQINGGADAKHLSFS